MSAELPALGHFDFEWEAKVVNRTLLDEGCPYIGNDKVWKGYNDLLSRMPYIARDWHSTKNRRMRPDEVYKESTKKVWWKCTQCGYEWFGSIRGRTVNGIVCKSARGTIRLYCKNSPDISNLECWYRGRFIPEKDVCFIKSTLYKRCCSHGKENIDVIRR